ncbi:TPA: hypothetical protein ACH3X1_003453 [Trebouxia sp. C0004]
MGHEVHKLQVVYSAKCPARHDESCGQQVLPLGLLLRGDQTYLSTGVSFCQTRLLMSQPVYAVYVTDQHGQPSCNQRYAASFFQVCHAFQCHMLCRLRSNGDAA